MILLNTVVVNFTEVFVLSIIYAVVIKNGHIMIKVNNIISILLFLVPLKRKVIVWPIIIQIYNYLLAAVYIMTNSYDFKYVSVETNYNKFIGFFTLIISILMIFDNFIYERRNKI